MPPTIIRGYYKIFDCLKCGKEKTVWIFPSNDRKHIYCSRKCAGSRLIRDDIPCAYCGKMFHPSKKVRYCSRECFCLSTRGRKAKNAYSEYVVNYVINNYSSIGKVEVSKVLQISPGAVKCLAQKYGVKIDKSKKVRHTILEWGDNWIEQQAKARERDNYICQVCGKKDLSRSISIHHIKPRRLFTYHLEDANVLSNLISLCAKHHLLVEKGKIPCPIVQ